MSKVSHNKNYELWFLVDTIPCYSLLMHIFAFKKRIVPPGIAVTVRYPKYSVDTLYGANCRSVLYRKKLQTNKSEIQYKNKNFLKFPIWLFTWRFLHFTVIIYCSWYQLFIWLWSYTVCYGYIFGYFQGFW